MSPSDKHPNDSGRRRFVKGVVGSSALAGPGTAGAAALKSATASTGQGGGSIRYYGIENIDGPAPCGMPQIPIKIADDGTITGHWPDVKEVNNEANETVTKAEMQLGGITYSSEWFQYCGVQTYEGIQPKADVDNPFQSVSGPYEWQKQQLSVGDPLKDEPVEATRDSRGR